MGDEADRLIDNMQFRWETQMDKRTTRKQYTAPMQPIAIGKVVDRLPPLPPFMEYVQMDNGSIYQCTTTTLMEVGTIVTVDGSWFAEPLSTVIDTAVFYEGFDKQETNQHPSTVVKTNITCSYCQKKGLHWGGTKGISLCLRDEDGIKHDCGRSKVTINL